MKDDACGSADECPGDLYCANLLCQDGSTGQFCDTTDDCASEDDACLGDPGVCESGAKGDDCGGDDECPGVLYCSNEICQDGAHEDFCGDCSVAEVGHAAAEELHEVTLTHAFFLLETEVTQGHWSEVMANRTEGAELAPSWYAACGPDCPVHKVNWWEAVEFLNQLSDLEGLARCFELHGCDEDLPGADMDCTGVTVLASGGDPYLCEGYRPPMEAEWEYSYRAGTNTGFHNGDVTNLSVPPGDPNLDDIAWYRNNSAVSYEGANNCSDWGVTGLTTCGPHPAAEKLANSLGLYDMSGNVSEWVFDLWAIGTPYSMESVIDPFGDVQGSTRARRGGAWDAYPSTCRAAKRVATSPGTSNVDGYVGFRAARTFWRSHCLDVFLAGFDASTGAQVQSARFGSTGGDAARAVAGGFMGQSLRESQVAAISEVDSAGPSV